MNVCQLFCHYDLAHHQFFCQFYLHQQQPLPLPSTIGNIPIPCRPSDAPPSLNNCTGTTGKPALGAFSSIIFVVFVPRAHPQSLFHEPIPSSSTAQRSARARRGASATLLFSDPLTLEVLPLMLSLRTGFLTRLFDWTNYASAIRGMVLWARLPGRPTPGAGHVADAHNCRGTTRAGLQGEGPALWAGRPTVHRRARCGRT